MQVNPDVFAGPRAYDDEVTTTPSNAMPASLLSHRPLTRWSATRASLTRADKLALGLVAVLALATLANVASHHLNLASFAGAEALSLVSVVLMVVLAFTGSQAAAAREKQLHTDAGSQTISL